MIDIGYIDNPDQTAPDFMDRLKRFLKDNVSDFSGELIGDLSYINHRAECFNPVDIDSVTRDGNGSYQVDYSFDWHVYNGCADMDESDTINESTFVSVDSEGLVTIQVPESSDRSTVNEF